MKSVLIRSVACVLALSAVFAAGCASSPCCDRDRAAEAALKARLPEIFAAFAENYRTLDAAATAQMRDKKGRARLPHSYGAANAAYDMRDVFWWTTGHYPGTLWYLYEATGDAFFRERATTWTELLAPNAKVTDNHDTGFIMYCSYGNARRLMRTDAYDDLLAETASSLCCRFNEKLGLIRSWGSITNVCDFLVIPDNMMNLELLEWAAHAKKGPENGAYFDRVARSHADVTMKNHFDEHGGCHHVLNYCQRTGRVKEIHRGQGASCTTAWSRGQAWAIYGYAMMFRFTRDERYRDFACRLADYAIDHPNMPADGVPYWDFGAPLEERDSSAAAIMASGLLELQGQVDAARAARYRAFAVKQLTTLASAAYMAGKDELGGFVLRHGVGHKPGDIEIDVPLDYGDYYFIEALLRLNAL